MQHFNRRRALDSGFKTLADLSAEHNIPADVLGQRIIQARRPEIAAYVQHHGMIPAQNPAELAVQATVIHERRIADKMNKAGIVDYTLAENEVLKEDQQSFDGGDINPSNDFAPALLAVIGAVGKKGIEAINAKREKDGKKPILSGKFWSFLKKKTEGVTVDANGDQLVIGIDGKLRRQSDSELGVGLAAARAELERQAQKDYLKRKAPLIIVGVILFALAIWYFAKHHK